jgi:HEAT repeat protein
VARLAGVFALATLAAGLSPAQESDPVYEGKKTSEWVAIVQKDSSARKRAIAVDALANVWVQHRHKDALPNIGRALRVDESAAVRARAALVIGGLRPEDIKYASKDLIDSLGGEKEARVRKEIVTSMARFPEVCVLAVEELTAALKDADPAVRAAAAEAIAQTGPLGKSAAPGLEPLLKDKEKSVRVAAVFALGRIAPEGSSTVAETMAGMLASEKDLDIRRQLIGSLRLLGEKSDAVVKALTAALFDPEDELRRQAARTLGTFGAAAAPAADSLLKVANTDKVKDIRVDAVRAFGSALGPAGVKARLADLRPLLDPAKQPDFEVRLAVVDEIAALGYDIHTDKETLTALRLRLGDPQVKVREAAGIAIRKIEKKPEPKKEPEPKKQP